MSDKDRISKSDLSFVSLLARADRQSVVESLLAGNDSGCFTTEMYRQAKIGQHKRIGPEARFPEKVITPERCRGHLQSLPDVVREVAPDEWQYIADKRT